MKNQVALTATTTVLGIAFPTFTGHLLVFLLITMILDLATGIRAAYKRGEQITSSGLNHSINKSLSYFSLICVSIILQYISQNVLQLDLQYLTTIVISFLLSREMLSIIENIQVLGFKIPTVLKRALNMLEHQTEPDKEKEVN